MFSVKIKEEDGHEVVKSDVTSVAFNPPSEEDSAYIFVWYKDKPPETIYSGIIYVMNENGKTIADYTIYPLPLSVKEADKN